MKNFSSLISHLSSQKGFTFIELILYITISTMVMTALIVFAWNIIGSGAKSSIQQEVFSQARYVSERIKYEIRNASGITIVNPTSISLINFPPDTSTVISLVGGKVQISKNGGTAVNLNATDTNISSLTFTNYTSVGNISEHIGYEFIIEDAFTSTRQEYQVPPVSIRGSAEVRSN